MRWSVGVVVVALAVSVSHVWADDCRPPSSGENLTAPWECCETGNLKPFPQTMLKIAKKCQEKHPFPDKPLVFKGPPSTAVKTVMTCLSECIFMEGGLLTADKTIDKSATTKVFSKALEEDKEWSSTIPQILEKCFSSYTAQVDTSLECKSGAKELEECIMREAFLACPEKLWSDQHSCESLKVQVRECPKVPVMLFKPEEEY